VEGAGSGESLFELGGDGLGRFETEAGHGAGVVIGVQFDAGAPALHAGAHSGDGPDTHEGVEHAVSRPAVPLKEALDQVFGFLGGVAPALAFISHAGGTLDEVVRSERLLGLPALEEGLALDRVENGLTGAFVGGDVDDAVGFVPDDGGFVGRRRWFCARRWRFCRCSRALRGRSHSHRGARRDCR